MAAWGGAGPRRSKPPKFGPYTQMTLILIRLRDLHHGAALAAVIERFPSLLAYGDETSAFVYDAQRALRRGDVAEAERLTHEFITFYHPAASPSLSLPAKPPPVWRRWLPPAWFPLTLTALLLTGIFLWR